MMPFFMYQLKAGVCIMLFTGLYYLLFRKETFHRVNRFYLLGSLALSAIIPVVHFHPVTVNEAPIVPRFIQEVTVYANAATQANIPAAQSFSVYGWLYMGISLLFAGYLAYQLGTLIVFVARNGFTEINGRHLVILPEKEQSFSFFNLVFLNADDAWSVDRNLVLQHELAHVHQGHSLDILLIQLVKIVQWFNPFLFLIEKNLKETHEYLADEAVLEHNDQSDGYRMLLLTQVFGVQPGMFSFFNYSLIKNRLAMMTKEKSPSLNRLKYLAVLPLVFVLGLVLCCSDNKTTNNLLDPVVSTAKDLAAGLDTVITIKDGDSVGFTLQKANAEELNKGIDPTKLTDDDSTYIFVEQQASFQGGDLETFRDWVQENLVYPAEAKEKGIFGRVVVLFIVNSQGEVAGTRVLRGVDPLLDAEAVRVIESSPEWLPGTYKGVAVKQQFVLSIVFSADESGNTGTATIKNSEPAYIFVDVQARFNNGDLNTFRDWVQQHLEYPPTAIEKGIQGRVTLQFAVSSTGKVCDVKILRGVVPSLDKEAYRVIQSSPDWVPATNDGKNVKQQFVMPVIFALK